MHSSCLALLMYCLLIYCDCNEALEPLERIGPGGLFSMKSGENADGGIPVLMTHASDPASSFSKSVSVKFCTRFLLSVALMSHWNRSPAGCLPSARYPCGSCRARCWPWLRLSRSALPSVPAGLYSPYSRSWHPHGSMSWRRYIPVRSRTNAQLGMFGEVAVGVVVARRFFMGYAERTV